MLAVAALVACSNPPVATQHAADTSAFGSALDGLGLRPAKDAAPDALAGDATPVSAQDALPEPVEGGDVAADDDATGAADTALPDAGDAATADAAPGPEDSPPAAEVQAADSGTALDGAAAEASETKAEVAGDIKAEIASDAKSDAPADSQGDASADAKADAAPDAKPPCSAANCNGPGQLCQQGVCATDCRLPGAQPCQAPAVCDVGSEHPGQCVDPAKGCVVSSPSEGCALATGVIVQCGPGTVCDADPGQCIAALPCAGVACAAGQCWGVDCPCERPPAPCEPPPLGQPGDKGTLNDPVFAKCGTLSSCDGGIVDLDFDGQCGAWGATCISGPDYVRHLSPWGEVKQYTGITNLNMGEVAALQGMGGVFGSADSQVAFTYTCCATCGCISTPSSQQGVAWVDQKSGALPNKIPANTVTSGSGPFGNGALDAGPQGLTWGLDLVLYAGNVGKNGDYHAVDLGGAQKSVVATFASRVVAACPFDSARLAVALDNGEVWFAPVLGKATKPKLIIKLPKTPTSIARDPWHGRLYAQLSDNTVVSLAPDGTDLQQLATAGAKGRIAMGPGGWLYHVPAYYGSTGPIVRWALPKKYGKAN